jgi:HlyD family secretion protein
MSLTLTGRGRSRDEAAAPSMIEFHSPSAALVVAPILFAARGTTLLVSSMVVACIAAAGLIPVDKVVTAQGRIAALQSTTVIQPLEVAIVRSVDVHEGDQVKKGQLLARLDPTFATADMGALQTQVSSLQAEVDRLQAEATGRDYHPTAGDAMSVLQGAMFMQRRSERAFKNENYTQKINSLQTQVQRALSDVYAYAERLKVASLVEDKRRELERLQVGSQLNLLAATDSRLEIKRGYDNAANQAAQAQRDLQAMQAERDAYNQNWRSQVGQDLTDQSRKLSDAQENLKKAQLRRQMVELRADSDSTVLSVAKVSPGSVMQSGEQLITLVPDDAPLEAEINIPGSEVGYVHPGNTVMVKLDTLPSTQYGTIDATIRVVSPDSFTTSQDDAQPKRGSQPTQSQSPGGTPYYRARVDLATSHLHDVPEGFHMMPGMPVTADVKVGKRTVLTYLLGRVLPVFMDGMRDP